MNQIPPHLLIAMGAGLLTLVILIFAEVAPKTAAALHPERLAYPAGVFYYGLFKIAFPLVWVVKAVNLLANGVLRLLRLYPKGGRGTSLSSEELRGRILEEVERFVGDAAPHDDLTMVVLKVVGEEPMP